MNYSFQIEDEIHKGNVNELMNIAEEWKANSFDIPVDKDTFHMNFDGTIEALNKGKRVLLHPSNTAITQLLMKIPSQPSIPSRYVSQIPVDLTAHNINRLMGDSNGKFILRCRKREDDITVLRGIVTDRYKPLSHYEVLKEGNELMNHTGFLEAKESYMSDDFLRVSTRSENINHQVSFNVGDITQLGFQISNGTTGLRRCECRIFAFRLACENGLCIPEEFGGMSKRHLGDLTTIFHEGISSIYNGFFRIKIIFNSIMSQPVANITTPVRNKIAQFFNNNEEAGIFKNVATIYDYVQGVTEAGKLYPEMTRASIEEAAGTILLAA